MRSPLILAAAALALAGCKSNNNTSNEAAEQAETERAEREGAAFYTQQMKAAYPDVFALDTNLNPRLTATLHDDPSAYYLFDPKFSVSRRGEGFLISLPLIPSYWKPHIDPYPSVAHSSDDVLPSKKREILEEKRENDAKQKAGPMMPAFKASVQRAFCLNQTVNVYGEPVTGGEAFEINQERIGNKGQKALYACQNGKLALDTSYAAETPRREAPAGESSFYLRQMKAAYPDAFAPSSDLKPEYEQISQYRAETLHVFRVSREFDQFQVYRVMDALGEVKASASSQVYGLLPYEKAKAFVRKHPLVPAAKQAFEATLNRAFCLDQSVLVGRVTVTGSEALEVNKEKIEKSQKPPYSCRQGKLTLTF